MRSLGALWRLRGAGVPDLSPTPSNGPLFPPPLHSATMRTHFAVPPHNTTQGHLHAHSLRHTASGTRSTPTATWRPPDLCLSITRVRDDTATSGRLVRYSTTLGDTGMRPGRPRGAGAGLGCNSHLGAPEAPALNSARTRGRRRLVLTRPERYEPVLHAHKVRERYGLCIVLERRTWPQEPL